MDSLLLLHNGQNKHPQLNWLKGWKIFMFKNNIMQMSHAIFSGSLIAQWQWQWDNKNIFSSSVVPEKRKGVLYHSEIENTLEAQAQICRVRWNHSPHDYCHLWGVFPSWHPALWTSWGCHWCLCEGPCTPDTGRWRQLCISPYPPKRRFLDTSLRNKTRHKTMLDNANVLLPAIPLLHLA